MYSYQNKKSRTHKYLLIEKLQLLFEQVPELVDKYERRESDFLSAVKRWLSLGEELMNNNRRAEVSELASLRGIIISAERGVFDPSFPIESKTRKSKASNAITLFCLNKAQQSLQLVLDSLLDDVKEAETIIKQIIAIAGQKNLLIKYFDLPKTDRKSTESLWILLSATEEIRVGMNRVLSLIPFEEVMKITEAILEGWPPFSLQTPKKHVPKVSKQKEITNT